MFRGSGLSASVIEPVVNKPGIAIIVMLSVCPSMTFVVVLVGLVRRLHGQLAHSDPSSEPQHRRFSPMGISPNSA